MNCKHHNQVTAAGVCTVCRQPLCGACAALFNPPLCWDCAGANARKRRIESIVALVTPLLLGLGLYYALLQLGDAGGMALLAFGIPYGWRALTNMGLRVKEDSNIFGVAIILTIKILLSCLLGPLWGIVSVILEIRRIVIYSRVLKVIKLLRSEQNQQNAAMLMNDAVQRYGSIAIGAPVNRKGSTAKGLGGTLLLIAVAVVVILLLGGENIGNNLSNCGSGSQWEYEEDSGITSVDDYGVNRASDEELEGLFLSCLPIEMQDSSAFTYSLNARNYDPSTGMETAVFSYSHSTPLIEYSADMRMELYSMDDEWYVSGCSPENEYSSVNVVGTWIYRDQHSDMRLVIHERGDNYVTMEYAFDYECPHGGFYPGVSHIVHNSDGIETRSTYYEGSTLVIPLLADDVNTPHLFVEPSGVICFDGVWTNSNSLYCFAREDDMYASPAAVGYWSNELVLCDQEIVWYSEPQMLVGTLCTDTFGTVHDDCFSHSLSRSEEPEQVSYNLYGQYNTLRGLVYLDEDATPDMNAYFRVYGDGTLLYEFNATQFRDNETTVYERYFEIDVDGVHEVTLEFGGEYMTVHDIFTYGKSPIFVSDLVASRF